MTPRRSPSAFLALCAATMALLCITAEAGAGTLQPLGGRHAVMSSGMNPSGGIYPDPRVKQLPGTSGAVDPEGWRQRCQDSLPVTESPTTTLRAPDGRLQVCR
ncbi:hypothetical protein [Propylenella binzhouense]|uniref:Lectin n=1 Tax=Propylenella binzhouense TaxID=2555902 RepID=A0A964T3N6_9HYPH|nr:hypothetical protein [Propylenella binzhouense]MYZ47342.1 hypothetical protein [Propylenella binzhouense]